jgi:hypothetical protein
LVQYAHTKTVSRFQNIIFAWALTAWIIFNMKNITNAFEVSLKRTAFVVSPFLKENTLGKKPLFGKNLGSFFFEMSL